MINKTWFTLGVVALWSLGVFVPSTAVAQHVPSRHGSDSAPQHDHASREGPAYAVESEATFTGTVGEVKTGKNPRSKVRETRLFLKTITGTVEIRLGPTAFLTEKKVAIRTSETLEVIGSRVAMGESYVVLARDIRTDDQAWTLRDSTGRPLWGELQPEKPKRWTLTRVLFLGALAGKIAAAVVLMS